MSTNVYRALRDLLPDDPLQVAEVTAVHTGSGDSTVQWPDLPGLRQKPGVHQ